MKIYIIILILTPFIIYFVGRVLMRAWLDEFNRFLNKQLKDYEQEKKNQ